MLLTQKKGRALYKNFLSIREDVQRKNKFLRHKLKKKKWETFLFFYHNNKTRRKNNFKFYDQTCVLIRKYGNTVRKNFKKRLTFKKKFYYYYGGLNNKYIKPRNYKNFYSLIHNTLEFRLDVILYRIHFTSSIKEARNMINQGHIFVNNSIVRSNSYILEGGDIIHSSNNIKKTIYRNIAISNLWPLPLRYLQINYRTLKVIILSVKCSTFYHPIYFSINHLKLYYR